MFDWRRFAEAMLEREHRPIALFDGEARLVACNAAFGLEGVTPGLGAAELWHATAREAWDRAVAEARGGRRPRVVLPPLKRSHVWDPVLELDCLGGGASDCLLAVVVEVVPAPGHLPLRSAVGRTYEVVVDAEGRPSTLLRSVRSGGESEVRGDGRPCYAVLRGQSGPCALCPVMEVRVGEPAPVKVTPQEGTDFRARVTVARRPREDRAVVTEFELGPESWGALIAARVQHLTQQARLTEREADILRLLLLGRSLTEIATASAITPRTAKYWAQSVLRKVGADSRADLVRLLM